mgnify:CR=1 FL=1
MSKSDAKIKTDFIELVDKSEFLFMEHAKKRLKQNQNFSWELV